MSYSLPPAPLPLQVNAKDGSDRPNFVIFMPGQLLYDSLGCLSRPDSPIKTQNIDAFASRGTRFTNCFIQASVYSRSRCIMFTGTCPHVSGHRSLDNLIKPWEPNLFRSLKGNDYHVACLAPRGNTFAPTVTELSVTKYRFLETPELIPKFSNGNSGQDESIWGRLFYNGFRNSHEALDYDDAVVLFMPFLFPHCSFQVEEPYFSMYERSDIPPITSEPRKKTEYEPRYMKTIREQYGLNRVTPEIWADVKATYYGMITRLNNQFGKITKKLEDSSFWNDTVTMFFTNHGEYLGDYGLVKKWPSGLPDSLSHEPLIIGGAGIPAGKVSSLMCEMVDLVSTMFETTSFHKQFAFTEGGFLTTEERLLKQAPYPYDIKAGLQHEDTTLVGKAISIRNEDWIYLYRLYEPAELYHRLKDSQEMYNLAAKPGHAPIAGILQA
ncbi:hypothetical protein G6011_03262 [Alternaria panax]|uniref:Sulfatase N-terminal domain-containing protein n=1 Tax=Alternaria panax TaxID=48097 RepID=A0AAD4IED8_9PLEO|nr:hypothetical protein G6011_03262 [Alternaria panax]